MPERIGRTQYGSGCERSLNQRKPSVRMLGMR
jgi:hypothetical protein